MAMCPHCGQQDVDEAHECASPTTKVESRDETGSGLRGAMVALIILLLSFTAFVATMTFTVLHQQTPSAPVIIQATPPTNDATDIPTGQDATPIVLPTATRVVHGGGNSGVTRPTPTPTLVPIAPPTSAPTPLPPTDPPQPTPTPTRSPQ